MDAMEIGFSVVTLLIVLIIAWKISSDKSKIDLNPILTSNTQVQDTYTQMASDYSEMQSTLGDLNQTLTEARSENLSIQKFSRDLSDILVRPNIRGDVGEKLLQDMCRQHLPDHLWVRQKVTDEEAGSDRGGVDVLIKYGEVHLPVDSKFPRRAWKRFIDTAGESMDKMSEAETQTHDKAIKREFEAFQAAVRDAVNGPQGVTKHINPPNTTEFGLMFVPNEAMYYALVSDKNAVNHENTIKSKGEKIHLLDWMISEKVIPVSPSIFYPFLEVIKLGVSKLAIIENLEGLRTKIDHFKVKRGTYTKHHTEVGKALAKALAQWEIEDERFKDLGKAADDVIGALDQMPLADDDADTDIDADGDDTGATDTDGASTADSEE